MDDTSEYILLWINKLLAPDAIYLTVEDIALGIFTWVTPVLLVIAIAIRVSEENLDVTNANSRWLVAGRDLFLIGLLIAVYFAAGNLINEFMNVLYRYFDGAGSIQSISAQMGQMIEQLENRSADTGFFKWAISGLWNNLVFGAYYLTLIALTSVIAFMHIAHAIGFGLVFCWGLIAVPISAARSFTLLKGWGWFCGFILAWPIVETLIMGLVAGLFTGFTDFAVVDASGNTRINQSAVALAFSVLNIVLIALVVVTPLVTSALVSNSAAGRDFVAPFALGAAATAVAMYKTTMRTSAAGGAPALLKGREALARGDQLVRQVGEKIRKPASGHSATSDSASTPAEKASGSTPSPEQRQARRGAIIHQQKNKPAT